MDDDSSSQRLRKRPDHIFAIIKGFDAAGLELMDRLGENFHELSDYHKQFLSVNATQTKPSPLDSNSATASDDGSETGLPEPAPWNAWDGEWKINLGLMKTSRAERPLSLLMGRGTSRSGPERGVDLLTSPAGEAPKGIVPVHAVISFHPQSGYLTIESGDSRHPVRYLENDQPVPLRPGQRQVFSKTNNIFYLGQAAFVLIYPKSSPAELEKLRKARDKAFRKEGLSSPDDRLPLFPNEEPVRKIGSIIVHSYVDSGGFGIVGVGVDISTGSPCAVKTISIKKKDWLRELHSELEVLLAFTGEVGLLQAWTICCDHGKRFGPGQHDEVKEAFNSCSTPDHIHIVMALAIGSFKPTNWDDLTLAQIIDLLSRILLGLLVLHRAGYMHRDVTVRNMLLMPGDPFHAVLNDFGKAIKAEFAVDAHIGPAYSRAPEVNGKDPYTNVIDVWSCGQAFGDIMIKKYYDSKDLRRRKLCESQRTQEQAMALLHQISQKSNTYFVPIVDIIISMMEPNPLRRPSIATVVFQWSLLVSDGDFRIQQTDNFVSQPIDQPAPIRRTIQSRPPVAPRKVKRRIGPPGLINNPANLDIFADEFGNAQRGREVGKMMRIGGGASTPINKPARVPFLETIGFPLEPRPPHKFDKPADIARRYVGHKILWPYLDFDTYEDLIGAPDTGAKVPTLQPLPEADESAVGAFGTGYKVPTLRPLPEADEEVPGSPDIGARGPTALPDSKADEDVPRAPGTRAKRTWEDRDSEDEGPAGKAAKLN